MQEKFDLYIIDDEPIVLKAIANFLAKYDLKIKTFTDPVIALEQITSNPPLAVFLDYNMPTMSGKNFIIKMSERYLFQNTSIFLISASDFNEEGITQLHTLGFSQVIKKPFTEEALVKALSSVMRLNKTKEAA